MEFVVLGVGGISFYARTPAQARLNQGISALQFQKDAGIGNYQTACLATSPSYPIASIAANGRTSSSASSSAEPPMARPCPQPTGG